MPDDESSNAELKAHDRLKLVYELDDLEDLINILKVAPATPIFHYYNGKRHVYVAHTLGDYVFLLYRDEPIPGNLEIPFAGDRRINIVKVSNIRAVGIKELASNLT
ncbi:MAG: hypothetical protein QW569_06235 [Candidatus Bathyarchaeia archaeon]|nr:hypothetical protein [Candidatus Bathyarchaeota archaeon]